MFLILDASYQLFRNKGRSLLLTCVSALLCGCVAFYMGNILSSQKALSTINQTTPAIVHITNQDADSIDNLTIPYTRADVLATTSLQKILATCQAGGAFSEEAQAEDPFNGGDTTIVGGTNLEALLNAQEAGKLPHGEIVLVCASSEGAYALERARNHGVPATVVARRAMSQSAFETALNIKLAAYRVDVIILAGFLSILSEEFVSRWPDRILNVHPSLIPAFCGKGFYGLRVHQAALDYGVKVTGATVHYVNEVPDGGQILLQKAVEVRPGDTAERLQSRVLREAEWKLLPQAAEIVSAQLVREKENTL